MLVHTHFYVDLLGVGGIFMPKKATKSLKCNDFLFDIEVWSLYHTRPWVHNWKQKINEFILIDTGWWGGGFKCEWFGCKYKSWFSYSTPFYLQISIVMWSGTIPDIQKTVWLKSVNRRYLWTHRIPLKRGKWRKCISSNQLQTYWYHQKNEATVLVR